MTSKSARPALTPVLLLAGWALVLAVWLLFAFYPAGRSFAWLASAQSVCFGSVENGLPSTWGWAVLILSPLSLLAGLTVALGADILAGLRWVGQWRTARVLALLAVLVFAAEMLWVGARVRRGWQISAVSFDPANGAQAAEPMPETYPRTDQALPDFRLVDQRGMEVGKAQLQGRVTFLSFAYAHCATICPFLIRDVNAAAAQVPNSQALLVTLDPWRDTPSALPALAARWKLGERSHLLSGQVQAVTALLKAFKVPYQRDPKTGTIDHPALVLVIGPNGRQAYALNNPTVPWLVEAARRSGAQ